MEINEKLVIWTIYVDFDVEKSIDSKRRVKIEEVCKVDKLKRNGDFYILNEGKIRGQFNKTGFGISCHDIKHLFSVTKEIFKIFDIDRNREIKAILKLKYCKESNDKNYVEEQVAWIEKIIGKTNVIVSNVEFFETIDEGNIPMFVKLKVEEKGLQIHMKSSIKNINKIEKIEQEMEEYLDKILLEVEGELA